LNWLTKIPIAHRGLHDNERNIPENSMIAFESAVAAGYPVELDVQLLRDNNIAVFHDSFLSRMTDLGGAIYNTTADQLKNIKLLKSDQTIPLLEDVLDLINGKVPVIVELKSRRAVGKLESQVHNILSHYKGEFAVESFNPLSIKWFKDNAPELIRGLLSGIIGRGRLFAKLSKPHFLACDIRYLPSTAISTLRSKGYPVIGYTAKSKNDYERAAEYCDNIIFEGFLPHASS